MQSSFFGIHASFRWICLLSAGFIAQAAAEFTSIYAFGDGVCTTTDSPSPAAWYHEGRRCNGRVWIETISQWQGITYDAVKNKSLFGYDSIALKANVNSFAVPADSNTAMFIVWSADADFVKFATNIPWNSSSSGTWNSSITQSISDHTTAINTLYNKGARFIVMPNAANVAKIPLYNTSKTSAEKTFFRNQVISFNAQFVAAMSTFAASKTGLRIVIPDVFTFFEEVQANPSLYEMVDPLPNNAAISLADKSFNGPGANYVFWDFWHPTAKFQMHLAAFIQQIITPVKVNSLALSGGDVQMQVANIPLGRAGSILGSANLQPPWAQDQAISEPFAAGGSTTKTYIFPASGSKRFYRAAFPVVWVWP